VTPAERLPVTFGSADPSYGGKTIGEEARRPGMTTPRDQAAVARAYAEHRPYLVDLAFRMLGDIGAAEDVVQDAFARLMRADIGAIEDERGWLIVVTSRLCLDQIRSARARRERAHDAGEIELIAPHAGVAVQPGGSGGPGLVDPADRVTFDDRVRLALLVMLERLSPAERVVFVLHDVFGMPFDSVAEAVGRTGPACRQLAKRARDKLAAGQANLGPAAGPDGPGAAAGVPLAEQRRVTERFIAASAGGDLNGLLEVLAPDAWGQFELGPEARRPRAVVTGATRVARNLVRYWGPGATLVSLPAAGPPALLGYIGRELAGVIVLFLGEGAAPLIQSIQVIADPQVLRFLSSHMPQMEEATS
jgi:RNA polymerase sigma-70 factor (ECF subfamily)